MASASATARAPRPECAIRPIDARGIGTQCPLHELPLVRADHVLAHPDKMSSRRATLLIGECEKRAIARDGALLRRIALRAPRSLKSGRLPRILRRGRLYWPGTKTHHPDRSR